VKLAWHSGVCAAGRATFAGDAGWSSAGLGLQRESGRLQTLEIVWRSVVMYNTARLYSSCNRPSGQTTQLTRAFSVDNLLASTDKGHASIVT
jgi:hypothetical protein